MSSFLEISQLGKTYPTLSGPPAIIVENFDLKIRKGEFITLIGHSGCGKSTVLSMIAGLTSITSGGVILAAKEVVISLIGGAVLIVLTDPPDDELATANRRADLSSRRFDLLGGSTGVSE